MIYPSLEHGNIKLWVEGSFLDSQCPSFVRKMRSFSIDYHVKEVFDLRGNFQSNIRDGKVSYAIYLSKKCQLEIYSLIPGRTVGAVYDRQSDR